jgi:hypothetical protein
VNGLLATLNPYAMLPSSIDQRTPEMRVIALGPYVRGLAAGIRAAGRQTVEEFADEVTDRLCGPSLVPEQTLLLVALGRELPDLLTGEGMDCFFTQAKGKQEDSALWDVLNLWRLSGLDKTPAIAEIEKNSKDPRTRRYFMSDDQQRALAQAETERVDREAAKGPPPDQVTMTSDERRAAALRLARSSEATSP